MVEPEGVRTGVYARQVCVMLIHTVLGVRRHYGVESVCQGSSPVFMSWLGESYGLLHCLEAKELSELEVVLWSELQCGWCPCCVRGLGPGKHV